MEKQIEEMAKVMNECCNRYDEQGNHLGNKCFDCECWCDTNHICCSYNSKEAMALYNAGYRKAEDVAREIFTEIEKIVENNRYKSYLPNSCLWSYSYRIGKIIKDIAELKKEYTEGGE